ncbi:MAG: ARMT1-like domain-containing protein, partial [Candidatus Glassbacteria bacterium]
VAVGADEIGSATLEEARIAGLDRMVEVIERGADVPGAPVDECGQSFRRRFDQADLVIAKGQGNYETLGEVDKKIYFLMTADCPIIAAEIGCQPGELALYSRN